jgi:hypothetical protein
MRCRIREDGEGSQTACQLSGGSRFPGRSTSRQQRDGRRPQETVVLGFLTARSSSSWMLDVGPVAAKRGGREGKRTKGSRSQGSNHVGRVIRPHWPAPSAAKPPKSPHSPSPRPSNVTGNRADRWAEWADRERWPVFWSGRAAMGASKEFDLSSR